jgi:3-dehydroquinate synthase
MSLDGAWKVAKPTIFVALLFTITFLLIGEGPATNWIEQSPLGIVGASLFLLAIDIVVPVPSSLVILFVGQKLGAPVGILIGTLGLSAGCSIGFLIGWLFPRRALALLNQPDTVSLSSSPSKLYISWLAALRAVPILGETSVIVAGMLRFDPVKVLGVTTLSNFALAAAYVLLGSLADDWKGLVAAIVVAWALPLICLLCFRLIIQMAK